MPHQIKLSCTLIAVFTVLLAVIGFSGRAQKTVAVTGNTAIAAPTSFDSNALGGIMWKDGGQNMGNGGLNTYGAALGPENYTMDSSIVLSQQWIAGFWIKRASGDDAPTMSIVKNESTSSIVTPNALPLNVKTGQWVHVTIAYTPNTKAVGSLHYLVGDRDPATNLPISSSSDSGTTTYSVDRSGGDTGYRFKFTGDKNSQTMISMSNYSLYAQTSVYAALIDRGADGTSASTVNDTSSPAWGSNSSNLPNQSKVYGGDQLTMRYYMNYTSSTLTGMNNTAATLSRVHLNLADVAGIDWDASDTAVSVTLWQDKAGGTSLSTKTMSIAAMNDYLASLTISKGNTVEVDVNGTAQSVTTTQTVHESPYAFYNGGAESYLSSNAKVGPNQTPSYYDRQATTPSFTITPSVIGAFKVAAQNESVNGEPTLSSGDTVMSGDTIRYTYHANYDKASAIDWTNPTASIKLPSGVTPTKYSINYGTTGSAPEKTATAATLAKLSLDTLSKNKADVTITVDATVNDDTSDLAATESSFGNSTRTYKASTPKLAMVKQANAKPDENYILNVAAGHDHMYLGAKTNYADTAGGLAAALGYGVETNQAVMLKGYVTGGGDVSKQSLIVSVTDKQSGQTTTKRFPGIIPSNDNFKIQFAKPGQTAPSGNGYTTVGQLGTAGDIITIKAVNAEGKIAWVGSTNSNTYTMTVDIAHLSLNADGAVNFGTVDLTGDDESYAAKDFNLAITNTLQSNWTLSAQLTHAIQASDGKTFYGDIVYKTADDQTTSTIDSVDSTVDTGDASQTQVTLIGNTSDARGNLYAQVDGNNTAGDYTGEITWTLTDSVK